MKIFDFNSDMSPEDFRDMNIKANKSARVELNNLLYVLDNLPGSDEVDIAIVKLKESIMWLGQNLGRLRDGSPYSESFNPENTKIHPTADKE